jgi:putative RecB family exonuclease
MSSPFDVEAVFREEFAKAVQEEQEDCGFPTDDWYSAGRGTGEDEAWWLANGGQLAQNFITWYEARPDVSVWIAPDGRPAIELDLTVNFGRVPVKMFIDLVLEFQTSGPSALVVTDLKSGSRQPDDSRQLAIYANAIEQAYGIRPRYGAFFMNRGGKNKDTFFNTPFETTGPKFDFGYLSREFAMFDMGAEARVFPANPGENCRRCGVNYACLEAGGSEARRLDPNFPGSRHA